MKNKSEMRLWAKKIRQHLDIDEISQNICKNIRSLDVYKKSEHVMIFYPLSHEINLLSLLDDNKQFYLPRVNGNSLEICPYNKDDNLILSNFKIPEPTTNPINISVLDLVLTPALCADKSFHRLGYGGGFYDRLLNNENRKMENGKLKTKFIVVIPEELIVETIPTEKYDIACDGLITQKKVSFSRD